MDIWNILIHPSDVIKKVKEKNQINENSKKLMFPLPMISKNKNDEKSSNTIRENCRNIYNQSSDDQSSNNKKNQNDDQQILSSPEETCKKDENKSKFCFSSNVIYSNEGNNLLINSSQFFLPNSMYIFTPCFLTMYKPMTFEEAYSNKALTINPFELELVPRSYWFHLPREIVFKSIIDDYFKQKRCKYGTFIFKLYNILVITSKIPALEFAMGARWVGPRVIEVSRKGVLNVFNIQEKNVDGALFHKQGNFQTHNFIEISMNNYKEYEFYSYKVNNNTEDVIRYYAHAPNIFTHRIISEEELSQIRYNYMSKKNDYEL